MSDFDSSFSASPIGDHLAEAARLTDEGDLGAAFELLLSVEREHPDDPALLCTLGVLAQETDAPWVAYDYFRRCLAAQPDDPGVLALLGAGLARYDDPDAEGVLRLAALTAPNLPAARLEYGVYLAREGMFESAVTELEAARALDPADPAIGRELGIAHLLAGADVRALESLEDAISSAPDDADLHMLHILASIRLGDLTGAAEEACELSIVLPGEGDLQLVAALAAASQDWMDEAWNAVARAEQASAEPDQVEAVEEAVEAGPEAAQELLTSDIAPRLLHERLLDRG